MKSLILHKEEVNTLSETGIVTVVRPVVKDWQRFENVIPLPEAVETERGLMDFHGMEPGDFLFHNGIPIRDGEWQPVSCPFGQPGEVRWVRETWEHCKSETSENMAYFYKADEINVPSLHENHWRSSSTMPQWASRFNVECVSVKVEQVDGVWSWLNTYKRG